MSNVQEFQGIFHGLKTTVGRFRISTQGVGWMPKTKEGAPPPAESKMITVASKDMKWIQWIRVARGFQLRIGLDKPDRRRETFDGFEAKDFDRISNLFKQYYDLILEERDMSYRGWNWGKMDVQASDIAFVVGGKTAFELPIDQVQNVSMSKNEVGIEFQTGEPGEDGQKKTRARDELVEMRIYIPGTVSKGEDDDAGSDVPDEDEEGDTTAAQAFHDLVKEKASIGQGTTEQIATFQEILCSTPRGKYDIDMTPTYFRLRNRTYDYKIMYTSVARLFLLSKPDEVHALFAINLDPPIRQGQTRYSYLVMQFPRDKEMEIDIEFDDESLREQNPNASSLKPRYEGEAFDVVSTIFSVMTGKKPTVPGQFQSHNGQSAVKCSLKANEGHLYFLDKSLLFISKQPLQLRLSEIDKIIFSRVGGALGSSRTFDLRVEKLEGAPFLFNSISREEHQTIEEFLKSKKVNVKNEMGEGDLLSTSTGQAMLGDDDEDMADSDDDERPRAKKGADEDDEDSEVDEDFAMDEDDDDDVAEEYDENYTSEGNSSDEEAPKAKASKKKDKADGEGPAKKKRKKDTD